MKRLHNPHRSQWGRLLLALVPALFLIVSINGCATTAKQVEAKAQEEAKAREGEALAIGTEAYIYGYPLVTMEMTRRVMTNVEASVGKLAPMGQFARLRAYPSPADKEVTAPNADTLYTLAWLDVSMEPWVISMPDMKGRYYLMPMLDGWTDVFQVPGKRTTGAKAQKYAITGPGWKGTLPKGVTEYKSPTGMVWILGRIYCTGTPADYKAVHALQDQFKLIPLSSYGKPYTPPQGKVYPAVDMKTPVREQVNRMDAAAYFKLLAALMKDNPPAKEDAPMVAKMAKIGIVPGQGFDMNKLDPAVAKGLQGVPKAGVEKIMAEFKKMGTPVNGWTYSTKLGVYGTEYLQRALVTAIGLGANRPQDAIYPTSETDADGKPYDGANQYVIHFDKGQTPPAKAFWSLTMYDAEYFFVPNKLNRYTVSSRSKFKTNKDGSVDVYIQKDSPGKDKESNWLPAPAGKFILMLRLYWPKETPPSIIDGSWKPPAVKRVEGKPPAMKQVEGNEQARKPGAVLVDAVTVTATVSAIDSAKRAVALRLPDGTTRTVKVGNEVRNFDQMKVGDQVSATYVEELALFVRKSDAPPSVDESDTIALAPKGAKPGIATVSTTEITAKVEAIDYAKRTLTLKGIEGNTKSFKVGPNVQRFNEIKKGDNVVLRYSEAVAITVEKP